MKNNIKILINKEYEKKKKLRLKTERDSSINNAKNNNQL